MAKNVFAPVTPGEMLKEEFLVEYGLTQNHLAKAIGIHQTVLPRSSTIGGALLLILPSDQACTSATALNSG